MKRVRWGAWAVAGLLLSSGTVFANPQSVVFLENRVLAQSSEVEIVPHWDSERLGEDSSPETADNATVAQADAAGGPDAAEEKEDAAREPHKMQAEEGKREKHGVRKRALDFDNRALTLGEPYLGTGPLKDYGLKWFGEEGNAIRPRAQLYGFISTILYGGRIDGENQGQLGYNLNLDFNFDLTNTERFHVRYQPFVDIDEPQASGLYRFHNNSGEPDHRFELTEDSVFAWFEGEIGEMFDFLSPGDHFPDDVHIAVGLIPLVYQNSFLLDDNVLGLVLSKPNIVLPGTTRVHVQAIAAIDEINAQRAGAPEKNDTDLYGLTLQVDAYKKFMEFNFFHLQNNNDSDLSQQFFAASFVSSYGLFNYAARAMFNANDDRLTGDGQGDGQLYVLDVNHPFLISDYYDKNYIYSTAFFGTEGWNDIAQGRTGRAGILFRGNGLTNFPLLRNTGTDSIGATIGLKLFFLREILTVNPEFSYLIDRSAVSNDQYAFGTEIQYIISNHLSMISKFVGVHNEVRSEDWGSFIEMRFKF